MRAEARYAAACCSRFLPQRLHAEGSPHLSERDGSAGVARGVAGLAVLLGGLGLALAGAPFALAWALPGR